MRIETELVMQKLLDKTKSDKAIWQRSSLGDAYKIHVGGSLVTLNRTSSGPLIVYEFRIEGMADNKILSERIPMTVQGFSLVDQLFVAASKSYIRKDETLKRILDALDSEDIIQ